MLFRTSKDLVPNELEDTRRYPDLQFFHLSSITLRSMSLAKAVWLRLSVLNHIQGQLPKVQKIAVKRLSKTSGQEIEEFKNEVGLIARLQHRNLVKLIGCCIHGEERILVLENMPNKGLDSFIFDSTRRSFLDWRKRFEIINGVARGVLYLHQD
ncbi:putative protein kinase RLK-Pelle-DLSV family [Rosa chinensis]|uniref:Protein kinase domain-containing protein n=1 Tax=Rosa chinensis TaxID=74649 RepID=A0A2P6RCQ0_ROSCH|nr:putative protein kinase RLK-Pelle-DLSV family [Rosa chinensis]